MRSRPSLRHSMKRTAETEDSAEKATIDAPIDQPDHRHAGQARFQRSGRRYPFIGRVRSRRRTLLRPCAVTLLASRSKMARWMKSAHRAARALPAGCLGGSLTRLQYFLPWVQAARFLRLDTDGSIVKPDRSLKLHFSSPKPHGKGAISSFSRQVTTIGFRQKANHHAVLYAADCRAGHG